jgi:DNA-binding transcriptional regulator GbsR (MarR family)
MLYKCNNRGTHINMQLADIFKRLGFPKHTDEIYKVLSESKDPLLVAGIASRAQMPRTVVYRCLEKLEGEQLIKRTALGRRTSYYIDNPRRLKQAVRVFETDSAKVIEDNAKEREKEVPRSIRFLYGPEGIRAAFNDVIAHTPKGDTFYRYTSERDLGQVNSYLASDYRSRRDAKKLERLVISNPVSGGQKKPRLERFIKFIPADKDGFEQNIIQLVYGKRISIIDLTAEQVTIIENEQLANFQKVIFKLLYKRL